MPIVGDSLWLLTDDRKSYSRECSRRRPWIFVCRRYFVGIHLIRNRVPSTYQKGFSRIGRATFLMNNNIETQTGYMEIR